MSREVNEESTPHDNDADTRPRIAMVANSKHGNVEVCVHGAEGETADDIADVADERFDRAVRAQKSLRDGDDDSAGGGFE